MQPHVETMRPAIQRPTIVTTPARWFLRGALVGVLFCASLNSVSYFFRSESWGDLIGTAPEHAEALGFPFQLWEKGNSYGGYFVDYPALLSDALFATAAGAICGLITLRMRGGLNQMVEDVEQAATGAGTNFQFSLRGLLLATGLAALIAAVGRHVLAGRPEVVAVIYILGPWILVAIAFLPQRIPWQQRVSILIPAAVLLILAAIAAGASLERELEFDKVLLGIFVCWTPQSALAAIAITIFIVVSYRRGECRFG